VAESPASSAVMVACPGANVFTYWSVRQGCSGEVPDGPVAHELLLLCRSLLLQLKFREVDGGDCLALLVALVA